MRVDEFDFDLPPERIALRPVSPRDSAKLLVANAAQPLVDSTVRALPEWLRKGDVLVFNDTRVIPAQLEGRRETPRAGPKDAVKSNAKAGGNRDGAKIGATLHKRLDGRAWQAFIRNAKRLREGDRVTFGENVEAIAAQRFADGSFALEFTGQEPVEVLIERAGKVPLPPYIASRRPIDARDADDYQTMFAEKGGAVAAPTASLHFTPDLLSALEKAGVTREIVTLHVGAGTFLPVKAQDTRDHIMHSEIGTIDAATAMRLTRARAQGRRIIPVGTTCLRLLESAALDDGQIVPFNGETDIFITPGYRFRAIDGLMTNFHLPRSTLLMLVSALIGMERMRSLYTHGVALNYRFYSYGDASLLLP